MLSGGAGLLGAYHGRDQNSVLLVDVCTQRVGRRAFGGGVGKGVSRPNGIHRDPQRRGLRAEARPHLENPKRNRVEH